MIFNVNKVQEIKMKDGTLYKATGFLQSVDCDNVLSIVYSKDKVETGCKYNVILDSNDDFKGIKVKLGNKIEK